MYYEHGRASIVREPELPAHPPASPGFHDQNSDACEGYLAVTYRLCCPPWPGRLGTVQGLETRAVQVGVGMPPDALELNYLNGAHMTEQLDAAPGSGSTRMPAVYLGHGAPPLLDDALWVAELKQWARDLPRPKAVLVMSAHWENAPLAVGATTTVPLIYDFYGFPEKYYKLQYAAPGAPELADAVAGLLPTGQSLYQDAKRGLDHGAFVPLLVMYPEADIPVLQISMPTDDPQGLLELGQRLAPLRDEGVLIMGSGFMTHNLRGINWGSDVPPAWSAEFDQWVAETVARRDIDALLDYKSKAPAARVAHPTTEHFDPIFTVLGAAGLGLDDVQTPIEGFWHGLSKRSLQVV